MSELSARGTITTATAGAYAREEPPMRTIDVVSPFPCGHIDAASFRAQMLVSCSTCCGQPARSLHDSWPGKYLPCFSMVNRPYCRLSPSSWSVPKKWLNVSSLRICTRQVHSRSLRHQLLPAFFGLCPVEGTRCTSFARPSQMDRANRLEPARCTGRFARRSLARSDTCTGTSTANTPGKLFTEGSPANAPLLLNLFRREVRKFWINTD